MNTLIITHIDESDKFKKLSKAIEEIKPKKIIFNSLMFDSKAIAKYKRKLKLLHPNVIIEKENLYKWGL